MDGISFSLRVSESKAGQRQLEIIQVGKSLDDEFKKHVFYHTTDIGASLIPFIVKDEFDNRAANSLDLLDHAETCADSHFQRF